MSARTKNPLHPSALSINDLTIGRQVIMFNLNAGAVDEGVIVSRPYAEHESAALPYPPTVQLMVDIRSTSTGIVGAHYLTVLGVVPYGVIYDDKKRVPWSYVNFVVDHRKRCLLPEPIGFSENFLDDLALELELSGLMFEDGQQ